MELKIFINKKPMLSSIETVHLASKLRHLTSNQRNIILRKSLMNKEILHLELATG